MRDALGTLLNHLAKVIWNLSNFAMKWKGGFAYIASVVCIMLLLLKRNQVLPANADFPRVSLPKYDRSLALGQPLSEYKTSYLTLWLSNKSEVIPSSVVHKSYGLGRLIISLPIAQLRISYVSGETPQALRGTRMLSREES
ncbi:hypothetical protein CIB48_g9194 [Xylaria polymorpha]|nr:hypothetical protein CIB48_g9194 [Xylaria polymorpha]